MSKREPWQSQDDYEASKALTWFVIGGGICLIALCLLTSCTPMPTAQAATIATDPGTIVPTIASPAAAIPTPRPSSCTVSAGLLNFRVGPGTGYEVIRVLKQGEVLTLTGATYGVWPGKWIEVTTAQNETGWINSIFCETGE